EPELLVGFEAVPLVDFEAVPPEPLPEPALPEPEPEPLQADEPAAPVVGGGESEPAFQEAEQPWSEAPPGFQQDGWRLFSKDEGEGRDAHRIFFFSKESPGDASAAEVPDGYEV